MPFTLKVESSSWELHCTAYMQYLSPSFSINFDDSVSVVIQHITGKTPFPLLPLIAGGQLGCTEMVPSLWAVCNCSWGARGLKKSASLWCGALQRWVPWPCVFVTPLWCQQLTKALRLLPKIGWLFPLEDSGSAFHKLDSLKLQKDKYHKFSLISGSWTKLISGK